MRASSVVNRQPEGAPRLLRGACQADVSRRSLSRSGTGRPERHCADSAARSVSAMFSHHPCLGVLCNRTCRAMRRASVGANPS
jgi:hypothetical protein